MGTDNVVLLGASGQVGSELARTNQFVAITSQELDLRDVSRTYDFFSNLNFSALINCAAFTDVDGAEVNKSDCFKINSLAVSELVKVCEKKSAYLIHISSDYVFDGVTGNYDEFSPVNPLNFYGLTKAWSEKIVQLYPNSLVIRTSHVFGNRPNIVRFFADRVINNQPVRVITGSRANVTSARDLAAFVIWCLEERLTGTVNFANSGELSWVELIRFLEQKFGRNVEKDFVETLPRVAIRPKNSTLNLSKAESLVHLESWQISVDKYLEELGYS